MIMAVSWRASKSSPAQAANGRSASSGTMGMGWSGDGGRLHHRHRVGRDLTLILQQAENTLSER
jgi:hypothetical protein